MRKEMHVFEIAGVKFHVGDHITKDIQDYLYQVEILSESGELSTIIEMLRLKLAPDDVVMELGTGLGIIATYCAKLIGSQRVFTYEVMPLLESYIRDNFALNGVSPTLSMCMLTDRDGEQTIHVHEAYWGSPGGRRAKPTTVWTKRFNQEITLVDPTFLILDIEGGEYELTRYMDFHNLRKLIIAVHPEEIGWKEVETVLSTLDRAGFQMDGGIGSKKIGYLERK